MNKTTDTLLIASTSTSTTTNAQPSSPAASSIDITSLVVTAIISSGVVGTVLKIWSDNRFAKQQRKHDKKIARNIQELKAKHEKELEIERQQRSGRKELIDKWEELLNNAQLGIWDLTEDSTYPALEKYFLEEFKVQIAPYIRYAVLKKIGVVGKGGMSIESNYLYSSDDEFRDLLKQELARLKQAWNLV